MLGGTCSINFLLEGMLFYLRLVYITYLINYDTTFISVIIINISWYVTEDMP